MKPVIASLVLFITLLVGIFMNARALNDYADTLSEAAEQVPFFPQQQEHGEPQEIGEHREALEAFRALWEERKTVISLTETVRITEGIEDCLDRMEGALNAFDASEFDASRLHLLRIIEDIRRYARFQLGSIL